MQHLLVVIIMVSAINAWNLQSKHNNRETASYDGDERPVTETDIWVARGFVFGLARVALPGSALHALASEQTFLSVMCAQSLIALSVQGWHSWVCVSQTLALGILAIAVGQAAHTLRGRLCHRAVIRARSPSVSEIIAINSSMIFCIQRSPKSSRRAL
jgi:hypothetical protein